MPTSVEHIHNAVAGASQIVARLGRIAWNESNKDFTVENTNSKRRVTGGQVWIGKGIWVNLLEILVVGLDVPRAEIRDEKKILSDTRAIARRNCGTLVNRATGTVVDSFKRLRAIQVGIPTGNHSIFTDENHFRGERVGAVTNFEGGSFVRCNTTWIRSVWVTCTRRNRDHERTARIRCGRTVLKIGRRNPRAVISDKNYARGRNCNSPRVNRIGISNFCNSRDIALEVFPIESWRDSGTDKYCYRRQQRGFERYETSFHLFLSEMVVI